MIKKILLIVDPQIDFISGTLPVPGATEAMNRLADYIAQQDGSYDYKIVTTDWHPYHHCSFMENGGQWPTHCVQNTAGAAIYQPLIKPLHTTGGKIKVLRKGVYEDEEYSIFRNRISSEIIKKIVDMGGIERIDLCGISGDVCIDNTLKDGREIYGSAMFHVLTEYSALLDGGKTLNEEMNTLLR